MEHQDNGDNGEDMGLGGETEERGWRPTGTAAPATGSIFVETGRGTAVEVPVGSPFVETLNRLADEARYGGFFRIFLNGLEVINPTDAPATIEAGMRISITAYDKVG
jgi:hypothetical protein